MTPMDDRTNWPDFLRGRMFDFRTVSITGALDDDCASRVAIELMTLDATGDDVVQLLIDSGEGSLDAALTVIDVIDLLGVPVHATCLGRAEGPAVGVLAVAARRFATPHCRLRASEPATTFTGRLHDVATWSAHRDDRLARYAERLAEATGRRVEEVTDVLREGRYFDAEDARRFGFVDEIARPNLASVRMLETRDLGFGVSRRRR
jgi:ATP-dependent Clp protease protease subunit